MLLPTKPTRIVVILECKNEETHNHTYIIGAKFCLHTSWIETVRLIFMLCAHTVHNILTV